MYLLRSKSNAKFRIISRSVATCADANDKKSKCADNKVQSFDKIPGPKPFPLIGTLYKYLPFIGEYSFNRLHRTSAKKHEKYGALVREELVPGSPVLWVFKPEDIEEVFKSETGKHPERRSHLALMKYRKDRPHIYRTGGLLPTNGLEWWKLRKELQKNISNPKVVINYLKETDEIIKKFSALACTLKHDDFLNLLSRLYLEIICMVVFNVRLDSFSPKEMLMDSMSSKLIDSALVTNSAMLSLDNGPRLWRFFETPLYKKMRIAQNYMEKVAIDLMYSKDKRIDDSETLIETYLKNPELDVKDVVGMACDALLAGIDTATYSTSFALYHLANNPLAQDRLREEAFSLMKTRDSPITSDCLKSATYTKAVLKENFRLNPISVGVGRILQVDTVLSGYHVPKGTVICTMNQVTCRLPEYFDRPDEFIPERWLRCNSNKFKFHPYLLMPFGHGTRSCIARRLAEQNMQMLLLQLCRDYSFTWNGDELDVKTVLINKPDAPIKLEFSKNL